MSRKSVPPVQSGLSAADFLKRNPPAHQSITVRYGCRCGNYVELHIQADAVSCVRCGARMKAKL